jgi:hypothetical protein
MGDEWGPHAKVFTAAQEKEFWEAVWASNRCAVFVDEGTEMIARDKDLIPAFTRIRHNNHKLFVIGHRGESLLPIMRDQITTLFLFRQTEKSAEIWAEQFTDKDIMKATTLKEYEFLWVEMFKPVRGPMILPDPSKPAKPVHAARGKVK